MARRSASLRAATDGVRLDLQQLVTGSPDGDVHYWVRVDDGMLEAGLGKAAAPDATISQSYETAVAVVTGELSTEEALMTGRLRLSGNLAALAQHQAALREVGTAFAQLRSGTSYG